MTQVEAPANLDRWDSPAYQLVTLILIRCGLRITDAARIGDDCIAFDADGSPYLRYYNHKMKRQALVPIDEELRALITAQLQRNLDRWPAGIPVLFPRPTANLIRRRRSGSRHFTIAALYPARYQQPYPPAPGEDGWIRPRASRR